MSRDTVTNVAHSINVRLKNFAAKNEIPFEYVLLRYALERFLYRLGMSPHAERFILKGASVFSVWMGPIFRVTRDADLYCSGSSDPEFLKQCFCEICGQEVAPDGIEFDTNSMQANEIKKDQRYQGTRITFIARVAQARVRLQFDIGFGDSIFPSAEFCEYPGLLDLDKPLIKIYPRYTVIAEKFEAMVSLGMKNSRLKDFFDIWLLSEYFDFDFIILEQSVTQTFTRRQTTLPQDLPIAFTNEFTSDAIKINQWNTFLKKTNPVKKPESLASTVERIKLFLKPVFLLPKHKPTVWSAGKGWK